MIVVFCDSVFCQDDHRAVPIESGAEGIHGQDLVAVLQQRGYIRILHVLVFILDRDYPDITVFRICLTIGEFMEEHQVIDIGLIWGVVFSFHVDLSFSHTYILNESNYLSHGNDNCPVILFLF